MVGFRDVLRLISTYVERYWETVYPQLDADDDDDPTIRINALAGLCKMGGLIRQLRVTPILKSRSVGRFSWTDCAMAKGEIPIPAGMESPPTQKQIDAAVMSTDPADFADTVQAVDDCLQFAIAIEAGFSDRLGPAIGPNLEALRKELKAISRLQKAWVLMRKEADGSDSPGGSEAGADSPASGDSQAQSPAISMAKGPFVITRREDVIEGLDKIIKWLERNEPSSPLPMLLKRAKRLSTMSFLDILRDLSPDGVSQAEVIVGTEPEPVVESDPTPPKGSSSANATRRVDPDDGY
jgi:type VI secretion system protein ImpA